MVEQHDEFAYWDACSEVVYDKVSINYIVTLGNEEVRPPYVIKECSFNLLMSFDTFEAHFRIVRSFKIGHYPQNSERNHENSVKPPP